MKWINPFWNLKDYLTGGDQLLQTAHTRYPMKLLTLKCAEICADIGNNWLKMSTEDMIEQFESLRVCCTPPLDRFAAAELLSCHSVTNGKRAFHSAILRWMAMPDDDTEPPSYQVKGGRE